MTGHPQLAAAAGPVICIRRGTALPGSARDSGSAARKGTRAVRNAEDSAGQVEATSDSVRRRSP